MKNILFLDVDGVLNRGGGPIQPELAELVNKIIHKAELQVVVSSDWRIWAGGFATVELAIDNIIDKTIILNSRDRNQNRANEIKEWISRHTVNNFAVLDDLAIPIENLFRTHAPHGITKVIAKKVIKHFKSDFVDPDDCFEGEIAEAKKKGFI